MFCRRLLQPASQPLDLGSRSALLLCVWRWSSCNTNYCIVQLPDVPLGLWSSSLCSADAFFLLQVISVPLPQSMRISTLVRLAGLLSLALFPCCSRLTSGPPLLRGWGLFRNSRRMQGQTLLRVSSPAEPTEDYCLFLYQKPSDA